MSYTLNIPASQRLNYNKAVRSLKLTGRTNETLFIDPAQGSLTFITGTQHNRVRVAVPAQASATDLGVWRLENDTAVGKGAWVDASSFTLDTEAETLTTTTKGIARTYKVEQVTESGMDVYTYTRVPGEALASFEVNNSNRAAFSAVTTALSTSDQYHQFLHDGIVHMSGGDTQTTILGTDRYRLSSVTVDNSVAATATVSTTIPRVILELAGKKQATRVDMHPIEHKFYRVAASTLTLADPNGAMTVTATNFYGSSDVPPTMEAIRSDIPSDNCAWRKISIDRPRELAKTVETLYAVAGKPCNTPVTVRFEDAGGEVSIYSDSQGEPVKTGFTGAATANDIEIRFNPKYLIDLLKLGANSPVVLKVNKDKKPWYMTGFENKHLDFSVLMPAL